MKTVDNKTGNVRTHVTLRCVPAHIVAMEQQYVLHILSVRICILSYSTCSERYVVILNLSGSMRVFPHYLIKGAIFRKKVTEHKISVLIFSTSFVATIPHFKKKSPRYYTFTQVFTQILKEREFSREIF